MTPLLCTPLFEHHAEYVCCGTQVCLVADGVGSLLAYDILCRTADSCGLTRRRGSGSTLVDAGHLGSPKSAAGGREPVDGCTRQWSSADDNGSDAVYDQFEFDVSEFFMLGSPVALVLAYRQLLHERHYAGQFDIIALLHSVSVCNSLGSS